MNTVKQPKARMAEVGRDERGAMQVKASFSDPNRPTCPGCGWHNTRLSHTHTIVDSVLEYFSLRAFRCRSCGNRFRKLRRPRKAPV